MKKILILIVSIFVISCSSSESNSSEEITYVRYNSDISGTWKLVQKTNHGSTENIVNECELEFGKCSFPNNGPATLEEGNLSNGNCSKIYHSFTGVYVSPGILKLVKGGTNSYELKYSAQFENGKLKLTKFSTWNYETDPVIILTDQQVSYYYTRVN